MFRSRGGSARLADVLRGYSFVAAHVYNQPLRLIRRANGVSTTHDVLRTLVGVFGIFGAILGSVGILILCVVVYTWLIDDMKLPEAAAVPLVVVFGLVLAAIVALPLFFVGVWDVIALRIQSGSCGACGHQLAQSNSVDTGVFCCASCDAEWMVPAEIVASSGFNLEGR